MLPSTRSPAVAGQLLAIRIQIDLFIITTIAIFFLTAYYIDGKNLFRECLC